MRFMEVGLRPLSIGSVTHGIAGFPHEAPAADFRSLVMLALIAVATGLVSR
jgi:hypothetical protein